MHNIQGSVSIFVDLFHIILSPHFFISSALSPSTCFYTVFFSAMLIISFPWSVIIHTLCSTPDIPYLTLIFIVLSHFTCLLNAEADDRKRGYNSMQTIDVSMEDMEVTHTHTTLLHYTILLFPECHALSTSFALLYLLCKAIEHMGVFVISPYLSSSYSPFLSYSQPSSCFPSPQCFSLTSPFPSSNLLRLID